MSEDTRGQLSVEQVMIERHRVHKTLLLGMEREELGDAVRASTGCNKTRGLARIWRALAQVVLVLGLIAALALVALGHGSGQHFGDRLLFGLAMFLSALCLSLICRTVSAVIHTLADISDTNLELLNDRLVARRQAEQAARET